MSDPKLLAKEEDMMDLRERCLYAAIAGYSTPNAIIRYLKLEGENILYRVKVLTESKTFVEDVDKGRKDQIASVLERFRNHLHKYADEAETIALTGEERNRVTMLKDLMDRAGTGAALKMAVSTPSEYRRLMADLLAEPIQGAVSEEK
jgi:hypothetical protein